MAPGSKRITKGEIAFEFPLRWENAAILSRDVELAADDKHQSLKQGQALVETSLEFDDPSFARARSFCVPRVADPLAKAPSLFNSVLGRAIARAMNNGQFCLIDRDGQGFAEFSVYINGGSSAAREPHSIAPVAYTLTPDAEVTEGDGVRLRYRGGAAFDLVITQQGNERRFETFEYRDGSGRHQFNSRLFGSKLGDGAYTVQAPGFNFRISQYDAATNSALIDWSMTSERTVVPVPDTIHYTVY